MFQENKQTVAGDQYFIRKAQFAGHSHPEHIPIESNRNISGVS